MSDDLLLEKVNFVCKRLGEEPCRTADPKFYREPEMKPGNSSMKVEEYVWYCDHVAAPSDYQARFLHVRQRRACRTPQEIAEQAGFSRTTIRALGNLSKPIPRRADDWGNEYGGAESPSLWLTGGAGSGKTTTAAAAIAIAGHRVDDGEAQGGNFVFKSCADIVESVDSSSRYYDRHGGKSKYDLRRMLVEADVLIVDDAGLERATKSGWDTLSTVIAKRCEDMRPTVYTCPYSSSVWFGHYEAIGIDPHEIARLKGRIGDSLAGWTGSKETMLKHVIDLTCEDMRMRLAG